MGSRYISQIRIEEIGEQGQRKLSESTVLIVGCGALGSPVAMYLAGAGIGKIMLADFDNVDISNLHRQVFYEEGGLGLSKAELLKGRIASLNSEVRVETINTLINKSTLETIGHKVDIIVDCADNPATTYQLDAYCVKNGVPLLTAGVRGWEAQIFTFLPGNASYSDLFQEPEAGAGVLPCSFTGITGPTAAFAASIQAVQVMKVLIGIEKKSSLVTADLLTLNLQTLQP